MYLSFDFSGDGFDETAFADLAMYDEVNGSLKLLY
jgi:hypothetical protein